MVWHLKIPDSKLRFLRRSSGGFAAVEKTLQRVAESTSAEKQEKADLKVRVVDERQTIAHSYIPDNL